MLNLMGKKIAVSSVNNVTVEIKMEAKVFWDVASSNLEATKMNTEGHTTSGHYSLSTRYNSEPECSCQGQLLVLASQAQVALVPILGASS